MLNEDTILLRADSDLQRPFRGKLATDNLNLHSELIVKTKDRVTAFKNKKAPVLADRAKSDEGKATAIASLATASLGDYKFLNVVATREADTADRLRKDLFTIKAPATLGTDPLLQFLFGKEIRDRYQGLTQQEKDIAFLQMAEAEGGGTEAQANRDTVLWAFQSAPGGHTVTPDLMTRVLDERARRLQPAVYAQLEQAEIMADQVGGLRDHVVLWLKGLGADSVKVHDQLGGPAPEPAEMHATVIHQG
jgi:hypothetical protein